VTIEKGREWGDAANVPHDMLVAADEASLAQAVATHLRSGSTRPITVSLTQGDLLTALGVAPGKRVAPASVGGACRLLPCDAYETTIEHTRGTTASVVDSCGQCSATGVVVHERRIPRAAQRAAELTPQRRASRCRRLVAPNVARSHLDSSSDATGRPPAASSPCGGAGRCPAVAVDRRTPPRHR